MTSFTNYHYGSKRLRKVKCSVCGKQFETDHPAKKTCSIECSMAQKQIAAEQLRKNNKRYYRASKKVK